MEWSRAWGYLSSYLFTRFVRPLISAISQSRLGCNVGGMFTNLFAYADDMVMLAPSLHAMHALIKLLHMWCTELHIECNTKKTVCMIFKPRSKTRYITHDFPNFTLDGWLCIKLCLRISVFGSCAAWQSEWRWWWSINLFAINGHKPLTYHTNSTNIHVTTKGKYKIIPVVEIK